MQGNQRKPRVAVIGCGGTISSISADSLDVIEYPDNSRKMQPAEAISRIPEIAQFAECVALPFREVGSTAIGPRDWLEMAELIRKTDQEDPAIAGYVLLHGTATIEETAYFLNLVLKTRSPVVLVGAQRPASAVSSDAAMNLIAAIRTAIDPAVRGLGVLVVLNDEIQAAREVSKLSTYRLNTFRTPDYGVLGHVDGDRIALYRQPLRKHTEATEFDVTGLTDLPRVDIVYAYAGADGAAVDAFTAANAKGLISAGLAPGIPPPLQRQALERAAASGVVVVQSSRAGSGRVARRSYLRRMRMVAADNLNPQKARVLLALALTRSQDPEVIQGFFDAY